MDELGTGNTDAAVAALAGQVQGQVGDVMERVDMPSIQVLVTTIQQIDIVAIIVNLAIITAIVFLTSTAAKVVDRMLQTYIPKVVGKVELDVDETVHLMIRRLVSATVYAAGLMLVILQIPQLQKVATAMLAGAGIAGIAIGFAAKDSLSNITSGIFIAIFQPFRVGDHVDFRGGNGQVEDLTLRHTVIKTWDNRRVIVPNSIVSTESIVNWSIRDPEITWSVDFKIGRAYDIDRAREIIIEEARRHPLVLRNKDAEVRLTDVVDSKYNLQLLVLLPGRDVATRVGCDIRESVHKRFETEGIAPPVVLQESAS